MRRTAASGKHKPVQQPCVLAIDLGTSGCKTALVSLDGRVLGWAFQEIPTRLFPGGGAEQDPADWWQALLNTSRDVLSRNLAPRDRVLGVCCSTQGEGTIPVDEQGMHLMNAILWMDARGAEHLRQITGGFPKVAGYGLRKLLRWIRVTGGAPTLTGKDPAAHMLYIRDVHPEIYARTHKFLNVIDYLNARLTGRLVATHDSIFTSWVTDNRDPAHIRYHEGLLRDCGIDRGKFPEIVPCTEKIAVLKPEVAELLGLNPATAVIAGSIDNTAAAIGSGAITDYAAHLYLGTSSWMGAHVPFKKTDIFQSMASVPCALPDRYLLFAMQTTAGGNLTFLRDKILYHKDGLLQEAHQPDVYKIMDQIAADTPPGSNGVIYTPWIYGERAPIEDRTVRAGIYNLSLENSRADIIRAFLEGIALNNRWLLGAFEKNLTRPVECLHLVGGGANSSVWCQIFADVLQRPVRQLADPIQANVIGAAFIGFTGLGEMSFDDVPSRVSIKADYTPRAEWADLYARYFAEFKALYRQNKGTFRRLNSR
ncbi:MAG: FGGY-family carbohydrate kinase [Candidatus Hydrogenedentes bacterium]|nr:FGGY-family carbohydrate kinase [Candidatus Hydrogenedentota bacterium]